MATIDEVNDIPPIITYVGSNGQDTYAYPFPIFEAKDIVVVIDNVTKVLTTDYTVTGVTDDNGGNVVLVVSSVGGEAIVFYRSTTIDRLTDYVSGGDFLAETVNNDFDRIILMIQERQSLGGERAVRVEITDPVDTNGLILPLTRELDDLIGFEADGTIKIIPSDAFATPTYVDDGDAATLVSANSYTDNGDAATLVSANSYTDNEITTLNNSLTPQITSKANKSGDTFTGPVHFNLAISNTEPLRKGDITSNLTGATVQYVDDSLATTRNNGINNDMYWNYDSVSGVMVQHRKLTLPAATTTSINLALGMLVSARTPSLSRMDANLVGTLEPYVIDGGATSDTVLVVHNPNSNALKYAIVIHGYILGKEP